MTVLISIHFLLRLQMLYCHFATPIRWFNASQLSFACEFRVVIVFTAQACYRFDRTQDIVFQLSWDRGHLL
jgi:hypothetical protein